MPTLQSSPTTAQSKSSVQSLRVMNSSCTRAISSQVVGPPSQTGMSDLNTKILIELRLRWVPLSGPLLISGCSAKPAPSNGDPTTTAGAGGGGMSAGAANGGAGMSGSAGTAPEGGTGGNAQGATGGEAGAGMGGAGATSSGGMGGTGGLGGMGGAAAADSGGGAALPEARCPEGPFPAPEVESTTSVCQNFDFNHNYNEGPTWIASENAFFFTNFLVGRASGASKSRWHHSDGLPLEFDGDPAATQRRVVRHHLSGQGLIGPELTLSSCKQSPLTGQKCWGRTLQLSARPRDGAELAGSL